MLLFGGDMHIVLREVPMKRLDIASNDVPDFGSFSVVIGINCPVPFLQIQAGGDVHPSWPVGDALGLDVSMVDAHLSKKF